MADYKGLYMRYMDQNNIKYTDVDERVVKVVYSGDNLQSIIVYVFFDPDGENLVTFRSWDIANFKESQVPAGIRVCNDLNKQYRWVKFFIADDGDITAQIDAVVDEMTCGEECAHLVRRVVSIVDQSYPDIMKTLWS